MLTKKEFMKKIGDIGSMIFDLDGTLIDSVPAYFDITTTVLERIGLPPVPKEIIIKTMVQGMDAVEEMIPAEMMHRKDELIEKFILEGRKVLRNTFENDVQPIPGIEKLFKVISNRKIPIGLATSTHRRFMDLKLIPLKRIGLRDSLEVIIAIEDVPQKKPAPDPLIACARKLGVPTNHCIYVGDNRIDIQAGRAAGMMTIGVLTGLDDRETLEREGPTMIMETVAELTSFFR